MILDARNGASRTKTQGISQSRQMFSCDGKHAATIRIVRMKMIGFALVALMFGEIVTPCAASVSIAVKRGQKSADPKKLPFASFTITMVGGSLPLQEVVLEDVATHKKVNAMLTSSFSDRLEYLTALDGNHRMHAQIIIPLKAGRYQVDSIEFNIPHAGSVGTAMLDISKFGDTLTVKPDAVNYCGSLVIATNWRAIQGIRAAPSQFVQESFQYRVSIEHTQRQDAKWATDVIPALRTLPSVVSEITNPTGEGTVTASK